MPPSARESPSESPAEEARGPKQRSRGSWARSPATEAGARGEAGFPPSHEPPPPRAAEWGGCPERARPRDGRYKSARGGRFAPAAPPRWLRALPAPGSSLPPTCGCGGRPPPGSTMAGTRRAAHRPRTCGSPPRAAHRPSSPPRFSASGECPAGPGPPRSCRLAAAGRGASCVSGCPAGPGFGAPWKPGRSGGLRQAGRAWASAEAPVPASVSLPFLLLSP